MSAPALSPEFEVRAAEAGRRGGPVVAALVERVAAITGHAPEAIVSADRRADLVEARDIVAYEARLNGLTLSQIGRALGGRDHTTIMAALAREGARRKAAPHGGADGV